MEISRIVLSALAIGMTSPGYCSTKSASKKPNVVFVFADQWCSQATGYSGDPNAMTPNIDKLAAESIVFSTAVSTTPGLLSISGKLSIWSISANAWNLHERCPFKSESIFM